MRTDDFRAELRSRAGHWAASRMRSPSGIATVAAKGSVPRGVANFELEADIAREMILKLMRRLSVAILGILLVASCATGIDVSYFDPEGLANMPKSAFVYVSAGHMHAPAVSANIVVAWANCL